MKKNDFIFIAIFILIGIFIQSYFFDHDKENLENDQDIIFVDNSKKKSLEQEVSILSRSGSVVPGSLPKTSILLDSTMFLISTYDQYGTIVSRTIYWKDLMKAINEGRIK